MVKVSIENIARVKSAELELAGITVVAGQNGTGKTTLSKAIYAVVNAYKSLPRRILVSRKSSIRRVINDFFRKRDSDGEWGYDFWSMGYEFIDSLSDESISDWMKDRDSMHSYLIEWFGEKGIEEPEIRHIEEGVCQVLDRTDEEYVRFLVDSYFTKIFKKQINCFMNSEPARIKLNQGNMELVTEFMENKLTENRGNVNFNRKVVYIESCNVLDMYNVRRVGDSGPMLSTATDNLLRYMMREPDSADSIEEYENETETKEIVDCIIREVTHGNLDVDQSRKMQFYDADMEQPVEISNLSAGIKVFTLIQRLLQNGTLKKGDILLIDEPEVNLHPEWQIVFAEILVLMQKKLGVVIYVNTHSPYFARALEIKMAECEIADRGRFYFMDKTEDNRYNCLDVTDDKERIYKAFYMPLENL